MHNSRKQKTSKTPTAQYRYCTIVGTVVGELFERSLAGSTYRYVLTLLPTGSTVRRNDKVGVQYFLRTYIRILRTGGSNNYSTEYVLVRGKTTYRYMGILVLLKSLSALRVPYSYHTVGTVGTYLLTKLRRSTYLRVPGTYSLRSEYNATNHLLQCLVAQFYRNKISSTPG